MGFATIYFSRVGHRQQLQLRVSCMKCMWVPLAGSPLLERFWSGKFTFQRNFYFLLEFLKITYLSREKINHFQSHIPCVLGSFQQEHLGAVISRASRFTGSRVPCQPGCCGARNLQSSGSKILLRRVPVQLLSGSGAAVAFGKWLSHGAVPRRREWRLGFLLTKCPNSIWRLFRDFVSEDSHLNFFSWSLCQAFFDSH